MKLLIMGYARHGKDEASNYLARTYGLRYEPTSMWCAQNIMLDYFKKNGLTYDTAEDCYKSRMFFRHIWFEAICQYNATDKARLARSIFEANDIYCGMRGIEEFEATRNAGLFDYSLWIDRLEVLPAESLASCTVASRLVDRIIDNNGSLKDLHAGLDRFARSVGLVKAGDAHDR